MSGYYSYILLGYNLEVSAGFTAVQNSTNKCVQAVITEVAEPATCSIQGTGYWMTYPVVEKYPGKISIK